MLSTKNRKDLLHPIVYAGHPGLEQVDAAKKLLLSLLYGHQSGLFWFGGLYYRSHKPRRYRCRYYAHQCNPGHHENKSCQSAGVGYWIEITVPDRRHRRQHPPEGLGVRSYNRFGVAYPARNFLIFAKVFRSRKV